MLFQSQKHTLVTKPYIFRAKFHTNVKFLIKIKNRNILSHIPCFFGGIKPQKFGEKFEKKFITFLIGF